MSHFPWVGLNLYLGKQLRGGTPLPWHYVPLWLVITTPLLYVAAFIVGLCVFLAGFIRNPFDYIFGDQPRRRETIFVLCFFLPLCAVIALHSVLYNGWRQMFFIYPAFLMISLSGLTSTFGFIRTKLHSGSRASQYLFVGIIVFSVSSTAYSMIKNHPYQNVYFNALVREEAGYAASHFDLDYWGLSYRKAFEYILSHDDEDVIPVKVAGAIGRRGLLILDAASRERLRFVPSRDNPKYEVRATRGHGQAFLGDDEFYSIKVHGSPIIIVYKLR